MRIWACGFELNSTIEYLNATGTIAFSNTTVRSGSRSLQIGSLSSGTAEGADNTFLSVFGDGPYWQSAWINVATLPSAENRIMAFHHGGTGDLAWITLDSGGLLRLYDEDGVIGSASSAISLNTWTKIDLKFDKSASAGSHVIEGRLSNSVFATSSTRSISAGVDRIRIGGNLGAEAQTTGSWFFDDWKVNDNTTSSDNSYPGSGKLLYLRPNAAGDNNAWTRGGADSGSNWGQADEVTPNDATDFVSSNTLNQIDDYNLEPSGLNASDVINSVAVGMRVSGAGASANATFVLRIKASSGGTVEESGSLVPMNATWRTNRTIAGPVILQHLTMVDLPGASTTAWTPADLDTAQIGVRLSAASTNAVQISALWLIVDYTPVSTSIKTINGLAKASVKTVNGLVIASVKSRNGLT